MALFLASLIALIPLAIAPGLFFYFDVTPKTILLLLGAGAAVLWWEAAGGAPGFFGASRVSRWFVIVLLSTAASLALSTLASTNPALSIGGSNWRNSGVVAQCAVLVLAYLTAAVCAARPGSVRTILRAITASALIASLYATAQYFGWDPLLDPKAYHAGEGIWTIVRPPSTLGHADYFGIWVLSGVFAAAALSAVETVRGWKWLAWSAIVAGAAAVLLSGTRSAMLGLIAGAALALLWRGVRIDRRLIGTAVLVVVGCALFYISPAGTKLRARVHWSLDEPAGGARLLLWRDSLRMATERWPLGYGPETFIANFALHQSLDLARAYPDFYHESPHNIFVDAIVSQGLPAVLLLGALCFVGFASAWNVRREKKVAGALAASLAGITIAQQFAAFVLPTLLSYSIVVAILVSLTCPVPLKPRPASSRWPALIGSAPLAALFLVFGVRLLVSETALANVRRDLDTGKLNEAAAQYSRFEKWRLPGGSADLWYSRKLARIAESRASLMKRLQAAQMSVEAGGRATRTAEDPFNASYNMAEIRGRQNDIPDTEKNLRDAISRAPNWYKPHWILAQVLLVAGRAREAEKEASQAFLLDGGKHAEVSLTLRQIRKQLTDK